MQSECVVYGPLVLCVVHTPLWGPLTKANILMHHTFKQGAVKWENREEKMKNVYLGAVILKFLRLYSCEGLIINFSGFCIKPVFFKILQII